MAWAAGCTGGAAGCAGGADGCMEGAGGTAGGAAGVVVVLVVLHQPFYVCFIRKLIA